MEDLKIPVYKISIAPKLLQPKICLNNNQKDRATEELIHILDQLMLCDLLETKL